MEWLELFKFAPGIAGMGFVAWIAYRRAKEADAHVRDIVAQFMEHLKQRDSEYLKAQKDAQEVHAMHFKEEQDRFIGEMESHRKSSENMFKNLMDRCKM